MRNEAGTAGLNSESSAGTPIRKKHLLRLTAFVCLYFILYSGVALADEVLTEKSTFRDYLINIFRDDETGHGRVLITRKGSTELNLTSEDAGWFRIGNPKGSRERNNETILIGKDITGRGIPNMVISWESIGSVSSFYVFELGDTFLQIAKLDTCCRFGGRFEDLDHNGKLAFVTADPTFSGWKASLAESPAPDVILAFRDGLYLLSGRLMSKSAPADTMLDEKAIVIQKDDIWKEGGPPVELWKIMLDLIYTGHSDVAFRFFDQSWPGKVSGKDTFLAEFKTRLKTSPYWVEIKRMNSTIVW